VGVVDGWVGLMKLLLPVFLFSSSFCLGVCGSLYQLYPTESCRYYLEDLGFRFPKDTKQDILGRKYFRFKNTKHPYYKVQIMQDKANLNHGFDGFGIGFDIFHKFESWVTWIRRNMKEKYPNKVVRLTYTKFGGANIEPRLKRSVYFIFVDDKKTDDEPEYNYSEGNFTERYHKGNPDSAPSDNSTIGQ